MNREHASEILRQWLATTVAAKLGKSFDVYIPPALINPVLDALQIADGGTGHDERVLLWQIWDDIKQRPESLHPVIYERLKSWATNQLSGRKQDGD